MFGVAELGGLHTTSDSINAPWPALKNLGGKKKAPSECGDLEPAQA